MPRLPQPGGDVGNWGDILNEFLGEAHTSTGSLKNDSVDVAQIKDGAITNAKISASAAIAKTKLATDVQTSLTAADNAVAASRINADDGVVGVDAKGVEALATTDADALRPFLAALASGGAVDILAIGDSIVEGQSTTSVNNRWINVLTNTLRAQFQPQGITGGRGYVPAWYALTTPTNQGFTLGGVANTDYQLGSTYGLGRRSAVLLTATGTMTLSFVGTSVDILFTRNTSSSFEYTIDGGAAVPVASGAAGHTKVSSAALIYGEHTLVITRTSGSPVIEGVMIYNGDENAGIRLWDGAHFGFTSASFSGNFNWGQSITSVGPELILLGLGVNDYGTNVTAATFKTNMLSIISQVRTKAATAPIVVVIDWQRPGSFTDSWSNYVTAMYEIAASDATVTIFDLTRRMIRGDLDDLGLLDADDIHLTDKGNKFVGNAISRFMLNKVASAPAQPMGTLLAVCSYDPVSVQAPTNNANSYIDADATNVKVTFTAPRSGRVLVQTNVLIGGANGFVNLRDSGGNVASTDVRLTASTTLFRWQGEVLVTGLTSGQTYTWKLGFKATSGTATLTYGGGNGPVLMKVLSA